MVIPVTPAGKLGFGAVAEPTAGCSLPLLKYSIAVCWRFGNNVVGFNDLFGVPPRFI